MVVPLRRTTHQLPWAAPRTALLHTALLHTGLLHGAPPQRRPHMTPTATTHKHRILTATVLNGAGKCRLMARLRPHQEPPQHPHQQHPHHSLRLVDPRMDLSKHHSNLSSRARLLLTPQRHPWIQWWPCTMSSSGNMRCTTARISRASTTENGHRQRARRHPPGS